MKNYYKTETHYLLYKFALACTSYSEIKGHIDIINYENVSFREFFFNDHITL